MKKRREDTPSIYGDLTLKTFILFPITPVCIFPFSLYHPLAEAGQTYVAFVLELKILNFLFSFFKLCIEQQIDDSHYRLRTVTIQEENSLTGQA